MPGRATYRTQPLCVRPRVWSGLQISLHYSVESTCSLPLTVQYKHLIDRRSLCEVLLLRMHTSLLHSSHKCLILIGQLPHLWLDILYNDCWTLYLPSVLVSCLSYKSIASSFYLKSIFYVHLLVYFIGSHLKSRIMFNQLVILQNKPLQSSFIHCCEVIE